MPAIAMTPESGSPVMTAGISLPEERSRSFAAQIASAAMIVATLATTAGWLHTARELNRLVAYEAVGAEALRLAQTARADKARVSRIAIKR